VEQSPSTRRHERAKDCGVGSMECEHLEGGVHGTCDRMAERRGRRGYRWEVEGRERLAILLGRIDCRVFALGGVGCAALSIPRGEGSGVKGGRHPLIKHEVEQ
jgi:hypothetical protein